MTRTSYFHYFPTIAAISIAVSACQFNTANFRPAANSATFQSGQSTNELVTGQPSPIPVRLEAVSLASLDKDKRPSEKPHGQGVWKPNDKETELLASEGKDGPKVEKNEMARREAMDKDKRPFKKPTGQGVWKPNDKETELLASEGKDGPEMARREAMDKETDNFADMDKDGPSIGEAQRQQALWNTMDKDAETTSKTSAQTSAQGDDHQATSQQRRDEADYQLEKEQTAHINKETDNFADMDNDGPSIGEAQRQQALWNTMDKDAETTSETDEQSNQDGDGTSADGGS